MTSKIIDMPQPDVQPEGKPDDDVIALAVAREWNNKVAYFYGDWHVYEGGCWRYRDLHELKVYLRKFLRQYRQFGIQVTQRRINGIAQMLEDDLFISFDRVEARAKEQRKYINMRNGLFNLETMQLEAHRDDLFFTSQLDFDYEPDAKAPHFSQYLHTSLLLPGKREPDLNMLMLTLEAMAYSLTARTDLKAMFFLLGEKHSGKSTLIDLMHNIMGNMATTIDLNNVGDDKFMLAQLVGKRLVSFTETSEGKRIPESIFKALAGGNDRVYAQEKGKQGFHFKPEAKIWWAMNHLPRIVDRSGATFSRINLIRFNRTIPESERNYQLDQLLVDERPGIFNYILTGWKRLRVNGRFTRPDQCEKLLQEYQMDNDTEATYADERLDFHAKNKVSSDELYQDYKQWCEGNGFRPKSKNEVKAEWRRLGLVDRKASSIYWHGAQFKNEHRVF